jgi:hypothetical protein
MTREIKAECKEISWPCRDSRFGGIFLPTNGGRLYTTSGTLIRGRNARCVEAFDQVASAASTRFGLLNLMSSQFPSADLNTYHTLRKDPPFVIMLMGIW